MPSRRSSPKAVKLIGHWESIEGIRRGLADVKARRMRPRKAFDKAFRKRNSLA
jgi:hypothetical protein